MRTKLSNYAGECRIFQAKIGSNLYHRNRTVLLTDLSLEGGERLTTHVWLYGRDARQVAFSGNRVRFRARVRRYHRKDGTVDFGLSRVEDVRRL